MLGTDGNHDHAGFSIHGSREEVSGRARQDRRGRRIVIGIGKLREFCTGTVGFEDTRAHRDRTALNERDLWCVIGGSGRHDKVVGKLSTLTV